MVDQANVPAVATSKAVKMIHRNTKDSPSFVPVQFNFKSLIIDPHGRDWKLKPSPPSGLVCGDSGGIDPYEA